MENKSTQSTLIIQLLLENTCFEVNRQILKYESATIGLSAEETKLQILAGYQNQLIEIALAS